MSRRRLSKEDKYQRDTLDYLEKTLASYPTINGIPVCQIFTYEIMPIINMAVMESWKNDTN